MRYNKMILSILALFCATQTLFPVGRIKKWLGKELLQHALERYKNGHYTQKLKQRKKERQKPPPAPPPSPEPDHQDHPLPPDVPSISLRSSVAHQ